MRRISAALIASTRLAGASVPGGTSGSSGSIWVSTSTSAPNSSRMLHLQSVRDVVRRAERHGAVDLEVDADGQPAAEIVHGDMVHGEAGTARDHHDLVAHAFIVARHRHGGESEVGIAERLA